MLTLGRHVAQAPLSKSGALRSCSLTLDLWAKDRASVGIRGLAMVTRRQLLIGAGATAGMAATGTLSRGLTRAWGSAPYSIVVVVVDDMRFDYRGLMSVFDSGPWIDCTSAAAQTPMCAPSRASMFTGSYAWRTPVVSDPTASGMKQLESDTVATRLHFAGYRAALVGKYQNSYPWDLGASYVPPGWTDWNAVKSVNYHPAGLHETDYAFKWASDYVQSVAAAQPFFLWVAPKLPHAPFIPPDRFKTAQVTLPALPPSFDEADVSDKPAWVRRKPRLTADQIATYKQDRLLQGRDMLALNDGMTKLMAALGQAGRTSTTVVVFTSDNALTLGEHRLFNKGFPYEESVRVPFLVRYPDAARRIEPSPVSLVDLPATACAIAGTQAPGPDGRSLVPLLTTGTPVRPAAYMTPPRNLTWDGVRGPRYKYIEYTDGFRELYDLQADPFELQNVAGRAEMADVQQAQRAILQQLRL
jgi:N-acetylglucosamine-6-sulfatase